MLRGPQASLSCEKVLRILQRVSPLSQAPSRCASTEVECASFSGGLQMYLSCCSVAQENYFYSNTDKESTMDKSEDHSGESPLHSKAF